MCNTLRSIEMTVSVSFTLELRARRLAALKRERRTPRFDDNSPDTLGLWTTIIELEKLMIRIPGLVELRGPTRRLNDTDVRVACQLTRIWFIAHPLVSFTQKSNSMPTRCSLDIACGT